MPAKAETCHSCRSPLASAASFCSRCGARRSLPTGLAPWRALERIRTLLFLIAVGVVGIILIRISWRSDDQPSPGPVAASVSPSLPALAATQPAPAISPVVRERVIDSIGSVLEEQAADRIRGKWRSHSTSYGSEDELLLMLFGHFTWSETAIGDLGVMPTHSFSGHWRVEGEDLVLDIEHTTVPFVHPKGIWKWKILESDDKRLIVERHAVPPEYMAMRRDFTRVTPLPSTR
jgi:hypothetical protein